MDDLETLRGKIDKIDGKILKLLNQRASLGVKIAVVKNKTSAPVFRPSREIAILDRVSELNRGPLSNDSVGHVFREIFSATRSVEKAMKIACLGPAGSYSHLATVSYFGSSTRQVLKTGIDMVFSDVERGIADYGMVPIENKIGGVVGQTLDLLIGSPVKIFAETYYKIELNLLSKASELGAIKTLYTHYMPLGQCRGWISRNLPKAKIIETSSTAEAAKKAKKSVAAGAIGAYEAARIYDLNVLAEKIEDRTGNQTRFLIISAKQSPKTGANKTSILFSINDESGALHKILRPFATKNLNLSKIQSRPSPVRKWEYIFFVDFEGHQESPEALWVFKQIKPQTLFFKSLGSYPQGRVVK